MISALETRFPEPGKANIFVVDTPHIKRKRCKRSRSLLIAEFFSISSYTRHSQRARIISGSIYIIRSRRVPRAIPTISFGVLSGTSLYDPIFIIAEFVHGNGEVLWIIVLGKKLNFDQEWK